MSKMKTYNEAEIKYKLLENGTSVLLERKPRIIYGELVLSFSDAPNGVTAVLESGGKRYYRNLNGGRCSLSADKLCDGIKVCAAVLDGEPVRRWICEGLTAQPLSDGGILVCAEGTDAEEEITELKLENERVRKELEAVGERVLALELRLTDIIEAYDFI